MDRLKLPLFGYFAAAAAVSGALWWLMFDALMLVARTF